MYEYCNPKLYKGCCKKITVKLETFFNLFCEHIVQLCHIGYHWLFFFKNSFLLGAPIFLIRPDDVIVEINGTASLICEAFGSPRIEYEWFRNGKPLNPLLLPQDDQGRIVVDFNRL